MPNLAIRGSARGFNNMGGVTAVGANDTVTTIGNENGETTMDGQTMVLGANANVVTIGNETCSVEVYGTAVLGVKDESTGVVTIGSVSKGTTIGNEDYDTTIRRLKSNEIIYANGGIEAAFVDSSVEDFSVGASSNGISLGNPVKETKIVGSKLSISTANLNLLGEINAYAYENENLFEFQSKKVVVGAKNAFGVTIGNPEISTSIYNLTAPSLEPSNGGSLSLGTTSNYVEIGSGSSTTEVQGILNVLGKNHQYWEYASDFVGSQFTWNITYGKGELDICGFGGPLAAMDGGGVHLYSSTRGQPPMLSFTASNGNASTPGIMSCSSLKAPSLEPSNGGSLSLGTTSNYVEIGSGSSTTEVQGILNVLGKNHQYWEYASDFVGSQFTWNITGGKGELDICGFGGPLAAMDGGGVHLYSSTRGQPPMLSFTASNGNASTPGMMSCSSLATNSIGDNDTRIVIGSESSTDLPDSNTGIMLDSTSLNIGTATSRGKTISIGSGEDSTGLITIGASGCEMKLQGNIVIGNENETTRINGSLICTSLKTNSLTLDSELESVAFELVPTQINGALNLGAAEYRVGDINIGTGTGGSSAITLGSLDTKTTVHGGLTITSGVDTNNIDTKGNGDNFTLAESSSRLYLGGRGTIVIVQGTFETSGFVSDSTPVTTGSQIRTSDIEFDSSPFLFGMAGTNQEMKFGNSTSTIKMINLLTGVPVINVNSGGLDITGRTSVVGAITASTSVSTPALEPIAANTILNIGSTQTTGVLNIGRLTTRTGAINIGRNSTLNGASSIIVTPEDTTINGNCFVRGANFYVVSGTVFCVDLQPVSGVTRFDFLTNQSSGILNLATALGRTGAINIGAATSTTILNGTVNVSTSLTAGTSVFTPEIQPSTTTTVLNVATTQTSGELNIGTLSTRTGAINIGAETSRTTLRGTVVNVFGALQVTTSISTPTILATSTTAVLNVATTQTSGILNIGTLPNRTGDVNIGAETSTTRLNGNVFVPLRPASDSTAAAASTAFVSNALSTLRLTLVASSSFFQTQAAGNNTRFVATTEFVTSAVATLSSSILGANFFQTQVAGNNTSLAATTAFVTSAVAALSSSIAGASFFQTQAAGNNTSLVATTAFVTAAFTAFSNTIRGAFFFTTPTVGDNSTLVATTAFVQNAITSSGKGQVFRSGTTSVLSTLTGTVSFGTNFTSSTAPKVILSLNLGGSSMFIPIGVLSIQGAGGAWSGFTWAAAYTSAVATISWYACE